MLDSSLALGLGLLAGAIASVALLPTCAAAALSLLLARRALGSFRTLLFVSGMVVGAWRAGSAVRSFDAARAAVRHALGPPSRCEAQAIVASSPVSIRGSIRWDGDLTNLVCDGEARDFATRARLYGGPPGVARGDRVFVVADLAPVQLFRNEGLPDPRPAAARSAVTLSGGVKDARIEKRGRGLRHVIDRLRERTRARIDATFAAQAAPMGRALVLGESDLDPADDEAFRTSGIAHLLAVSGSHLVIVVLGAVAIANALLWRIPRLSGRWDTGRVTAAAGGAFAWLYADFAGGSGSACRAAAMLSAALAARALGRRPQGARAFGFSLVGMAMFDPLVAFDLSFLLSAAATAGLMLLQRPLAQSGRARVPVVLHPIAGAMATTLAATIPCGPLLAAIAPTLPVGGIVANLLAVPVGELVALPICLAHVVLGWMPSAERGAGLIASGSLLVVRGIARATAHAHWLSLPVPPPTAWQNVVIATAASALLSARSGRRIAIGLMGAAALLAGEVAEVRAGAPRGVLRITVLDVGQGDASVVDLPDGSAMLVDAGGLVGSPVDPGRSVVAPLLRERRRSRMRAVVLTHPHPDHFLGLGASLEPLDVAEFWDSGQGEREGAGESYAAILGRLRARGVPILRPDTLCRGPRSLGGASVEVLSPCPEAVPFINANDNSIVVRIRFGDRAALLVGDAERAEEEALLAQRRSSLRADFLKVGHHGSRTSSSPEFVRTVAPTDAAISCGVRNRFGHPHPSTLAVLSASGAAVHRTDRDGSITWETDGRFASVRTAAEPHDPWEDLVGLMRRGAIRR